MALAPFLNGLVAHLNAALPSDLFGKVTSRTTGEDGVLTVGSSYAVDEEDSPRGRHVAFIARIDPGRPDAVKLTFDDDDVRYLKRHDPGAAMDIQRYLALEASSYFVDF